MVALAALVGLTFGWRYASGPAEPDGPPSVRVLKLLPGTFMWADAPADARYLPAGLAAADAERLKLLLLRGEDGVLAPLHRPRRGGPAGPRGGASRARPGRPWRDGGADFGRADIACRQAAPGFEFALRHRWALDGSSLTPGTPALAAVHGREVDGDWVFEPAVPGR